MGRLLKMFAVVFVLLSCWLCGFAQGKDKKSAIKKVNIPVQIGVFDGNWTPLRSTTGIRIVVRQFGRTPWPSDRWAYINGVPAQDGYFKTTAEFPVDTVFVENLVEMANRQGY